LWKTEGLWEFRDADVQLLLLLLLFFFFFGD
jgi:hypothetical protein